VANGRILLVDDSEVLRLTTAALLEDAGYQVIEAASLAQARASLGRSEIVAAVVDYHLGDGLGSALLEDVRAAHPRAAFILLSGTSEALPEIGDLYLLKGMAPEEMVARIAAAIAGRR
jgi:DNA-binding response OmpR family regulator